jgi:CheY-like chemotaxis protein
MMNKEFSFIVIDDSELDCFVIQKVIEHTENSLGIKTYQNAQQALDAIRNSSENANQPAIILLDLQMPDMNGFEFVEEFEKFPPEIKNNYSIVILSIISSERDHIDLRRKFASDKVNSVIEKPLTTEKLFSILSRLRSA